MSIHEDGLKFKIKGKVVAIKIDDNHPLITLGNSLPWHQLYEIILPELQNTTAKGKWWCGRALKVRVHLGVYMLQQLFNKKDRQIETEVMENAVYQIFCGRGIVDN